MASYSQRAIDDLLEHLDALDVIELIDYHPETLQRTGDEVKSWCPICQDHSGRWLTVSLQSKEFESDPPNGPHQTGNIIDLYARCNHLSYVDAVKELADEFGILLLDDSVEENPDELVEDGNQYLAQAMTAQNDAEKVTNIAEADKRFRRLMELKPDSIPAQEGVFRLRLLDKNVIELTPATRRLIQMQEEQGEFESLAECARAHLDVSPADTEIREKLAETLFKLGNKEEGVGELLAIADMAEQGNRYDEALEIYRKAGKLAPDIVDVQPMIVNLLNLMGRGDEAVSEMKAHAEQFREEKRYEDAQREYDSVLEINPDDDDVRIAVIDMAIQRGLDEESLADCMGHVERLLKSGSFDRAAEALSFLAAERPDDTSVIAKMVEAYRSADEEDMARAMEHRLVELFSEAGETQHAIQQLEALLQSDPDDLRALETMSELQLDSGDKVVAAGSLLRLAKAEFQSGDNDSALERVGEILKIAPADADALQLRVRLLFAKGENEDALRHATKLAETMEKEGVDERLFQFLEFVHGQAPNDIATVRKLADVSSALGNTTRRDELRRSLIEAMIASGKLADAEKLLKEFIEAEGDHPDLMESVATAYAAKGNKAKARTIYLQLADAHQKTERTTACRMVLERLLEVEPNDVEALTRLSDICAESGDEDGLVEVAHRLMHLHRKKKEYAEAIEQAEMVLDMQPKHEPTLRVLLSVLEEKGEKDAALDVADRLIESYKETGKAEEEAELLAHVTMRDPGRTGKLERLIVLLQEIGDTDALIKHLDRYLEAHKAQHDQCIVLIRDIQILEPELPELHERLIKLFADAGRKDDQIAQIQTLIELSERKGETERALKLYDQALAAAPDSISTRAGLIALLQGAGKTTEALPHILQLARQFQRMRKLDEAEQCYSEAHKIDPQSEEVYRAHIGLLREEDRENDAVEKLRELAASFAARSKFEKAIAVYKEVLESQPGDQEARRSIIEMKRQSGRSGEVIEELSALADMLMREGDVEGSIATRREAIEAAPKIVKLREALIRQLRDHKREEEACREEIDLAIHYADAKEPQKGLNIISQLLQDDPANIPARRGRAQVYDAMGDEKRALKEYREIERLRGGGAAAVETFSEEAVPPSRISPPTPVAVAQAAPQQPLGLSILPEFNFETFVVGQSNKFAYATARSVAEDPGNARNPLFLYAEVGLGKTHLMHAIANHLKASHPEKQIYYTSTEDFTTELIEAIDGNHVGAFRNRHRGADVLLLDDVQFLADKEKAQEEFFHIFNMLHQARKQIVLTSDRPPKDISHLDARLRTRFGQGVIVDITAPNLENRVEILRLESERRGIEIPAATLKVLAENITTNVRELKGAHNQLLTQHEMAGEPLTPEAARSILDKYYLT